MKVVLPFLRELAQQTQKITNSAGKYSIFKPARGLILPRSGEENTEQ